jgi:hypothetical protein
MFVLSPVVYHVRMIIFETKYIVGVEDGAIYDRRAIVRPYGYATMDAVSDVYCDITVQGLQKHDLVVSADVIDGEGATNIPYLMLHYLGDCSIIAPQVALELDARLATPELARKLQNVPSADLEELGLKALTNELSRRYRAKQR